jgi:hypothetical protein
LAGATQSTSAAQVGKQSLPPHWKGAQVWVPWSMQIPLPSQVEARILMALAQVDSLHTVSLP